MLKPPYWTLMISLFVTGTPEPLAGQTDAPDKPIGVEIRTEQQIQSGVQTQRLSRENFQPEVTIYGHAVSLLPLVELRTRYLSALSETRNSQARLQLTQKAIARAQHLHDSGVAAKRTVEEQHAQWQSEQAQAQNAQWTTQGIHDEAVISWGQKLADLFLQQDSRLLTPYLNGQQTLLLVTLPDGISFPSGSPIKVSPSGQRDQAQDAEWLSKAPQFDGLTQGESHFITTRHPGIRTGARIAAWLAKQPDTVPGVIIPASALVWHLGQAFVYVKTGPEHFIRRPIHGFDQTRTGYFIGQGLIPGETIVTTGAQMLLSEEFKAQIPDEDDDD